MLRLAGPPVEAFVSTVRESILGVLDLAGEPIEVIDAVQDATERIELSWSEGGLASTLKTDSDDWKFDDAATTIEICGVVYPLTGSQYRVVKHLAQKSGGRWTTGDELKEFAGSDERVDRIIQRLDEVIKFHIESRRGTGYCWHK